MKLNLFAIVFDGYCGHSRLLQTNFSFALSLLLPHLAESTLAEHKSLSLRVYVDGGGVDDWDGEHKSIKSNPLH